MRTASQPEESISIFSIRNPQFSRTTLNCKVCFHISADGERRRSAPRNCATIKAHGIGKDIAAEGGGSGGALQNDPRRRPGGGGALGRERFGDAAGGAAAVAEAGADRFFGVRIHGGAGEISAADLAAGRIPERTRGGLDVLPGCALHAAAGGRAGPWVRFVQPVPAAGGVRDRQRAGRERDRLRAHGGRFLRSAAAEHDVHGAVERAAGGDDIAESGLPRSEERRVGKECRSRWSPYH